MNLPNKFLQLTISEAVNVIYGYVADASGFTLVLKYATSLLKLSSRMIVLSSAKLLFEPTLTVVTTSVDLVLVLAANSNQEQYLSSLSSFSVTVLNTFLFSSVLSLTTNTIQLSPDLIWNLLVVPEVILSPLASTATNEPANASAPTISLSLSSATLKVRSKPLAVRLFKVAASMGKSNALQKPKATGAPLVPVASKPAVIEFAPKDKPTPPLYAALELNDFDTPIFANLPSNALFSKVYSPLALLTGFQRYWQIFAAVIPVDPFALTSVAVADVKFNNLPFSAAMKQ